MVDELGKIKVKDLILRRIDSKTANAFVRKHHYSGKVVLNSNIHFGVIYNNVLCGVLSYGSSLDKKNVIGLVKNTQWNEFLELNRMAFIDELPKNSESRCIAISLKLLKKFNPQMKWIISFADACQCGDGTIYRASGFRLVGIKKNTTMIKTPDGKIIADIAVRTSRQLMNKYGKTSQYPKVKGYMMKYIYFYDTALEKNLSVEPVPYEKIKEIGAGMYKGVNA